MHPPLAKAPRVEQTSADLTQNIPQTEELLQQRLQQRLFLLLLLTLISTATFRGKEHGEKEVPLRESQGRGV